jgi:hypothetical protein
MISLRHKIGLFWALCLQNTFYSKIKISKYLHTLPKNQLFHESLLIAVWPFYLSF